MSPNYEQGLFGHWPGWFRSHGQASRPLMGFGFECGDGWYRIVWDLFECFESFTPELENTGVAFEVLRVKQKMGELRIAVSHTNEAIEAEIERARQRSVRTCEVCGGPGDLRVDHHGWWATRCRSHKDV